MSVFENKKMKQLMETIVEYLFSTHFVTFIGVLSFAGIFGSGILMLPALREIIIFLAERFLVHHPLNHEIWMQNLYSFSIWGIGIAAVCTSFFISINDTKFRPFQIFLVAAILLLIIVYTSIYNNNYGTNFLNSDASAELLGAKVLADNNALFSRKWYYATEFLFVYRQPVAILLFKLFDDWALIRSLNGFFQLVLLAGSYIFMMRQTKVPLKYILFSSWFLVVPLSYAYWADMLFNLYYALFVARVFLLIGFFIPLVYCKFSKLRRVCYTILFITGCLILGLDGIRVIYNFLIPLFITVCVAVYFSIIDKDKFTFKICIAGLIAGILGYFVNNSILHNYFTFHKYNAVYDIWNNGQFFNKLSTIVFNVYLDFFGYKQVPVMTLKGILSGISLTCFFGTVCLMFQIIKTTIGKYDNMILRAFVFSKTEHFFILYFITSMVFQLVFFQFFGTDITPRYFFAASVFVFPVFGIIIFLFQEKLYSICRTFIFLLSVFYLFGNGASLYFEHTKININFERNSYLSWLDKNNLKFGFASFWNANVTTELSNGKIEMVGLMPNIDVDIERFKWLSPAKFDDPYYHIGQAFLLLTKEEWNKQKTKAVFSGITPSFEDDFYVVIVYESTVEVYQNVIKFP